MRRAVDVRGEGHPVLVDPGESGRLTASAGPRSDLPDLVRKRPNQFAHAVLQPEAEAEDLVAAAVGYQRAVPAHEAVQSAQLGDDLSARSEEKVVSIGKDDLRA